MKTIKTTMNSEPLLETKDREDVARYVQEQSAPSGDLCIIKSAQTVMGLTRTVESYINDMQLTPEFDTFTGYVRAHLFTSGKEEKSYIVAKTRFVQWMIVSKIPMSSLHVQVCSRILDELFDPHELTVDMIPFEYNAPRNIRKPWFDIWRMFYFMRLAMIPLLLILGFVMSQELFVSVPSFTIALLLTIQPACDYWRARKYWRDLAMGLECINIELPQMVPDHCTEELYKGKFPAGRIKVSRVTCTPRFTQTGFTIAYDYWYIPRSCTHNETVAIRQRMLCDPIGTPEERREFWEDAFQLWKRLSPLPKYSVQMSPENLEDWFKRYPGSRARYLEATQARMDMYPTLTIDSDTIGFVKREAMFSKVGKMHPRWISGKHDEYLLTTGPTYWHYLQMVKAQCFTRFEDIMTHGFFYTSGFDPSQLGKCVSWFEDNGWHGLISDISRNDGHTEVEALDCEVKCYADLNFPPEFTRAFTSDCKRNSGRSNNGVKYTTNGKMPSGKCNTSFGNSLRAFLIVCRYFRTVHNMIPGRDFVAMVLGDDVVVFCRKILDHSLYPEYFRRAGHKVEYEVFDNESYDHVTFCSGYFWRGVEHRILGPKPFRILAKSFMPTSTTIRTEEQLACWQRDVAVGMAKYIDLPVLGVVLRRILLQSAHLPASPAKIKRLSRKNLYSIWGKDFQGELDIEACHHQFANIYHADSLIYETLLKKVVNFKHMNYSHPLLDYGLMRDGVLNKNSLNLYRANPIIARHITPVRKRGFLQTWFTWRYFGIA